MTLSVSGDSITFPDLSTQASAQVGFKNKLINSQGLINQRGVSGTVTLAAGIYGHDRFKAGASGVTYTFALSANVVTFTITAGSLIQVVEGLNLQTGTFCLGWAGTAQGKIAAGSFAAAGVTASITGGTNTNIEFGTGTLSLPQLERGTTATTFDYRDYGRELIMCQRYYEIGDVVRGAPYVRPAGVNTTDANCFATVQFKLTKRSTPSMSGNGSFASVTGWVDISVNEASAALTANNGSGEAKIGNWVSSAEL